MATTAVTELFETSDNSSPRHLAVVSPLTNYGNLSPALAASVADITAAVIHLKAVLNNTFEADCLSPPQ